jgi:hypothetical protein
MLVSKPVMQPYRLIKHEYGLLNRHRPHDRNEFEEHYRLFSKLGKFMWRHRDKLMMRHRDRLFGHKCRLFKTNVRHGYKISRPGGWLMSKPWHASTGAGQGRALT